MINVGKYSFPNEVTFAEALKIAKIAVDKYSGKMSNKDVAETMGYKIKNPSAISGYIFRKFDDMCAYNLMKRERGFLSVTAIGYEALDKVDSRKAEEGKAKAIRQIRIVNEAFTKWNGEIPTETAFLAKISTDFAIPWQEAQKCTESLRKLLIEVFPYLKTTPDTTRTIVVTDQGVGRDEVMVEKSISETPIGLNNELRTEEYGILKIKDEVAIDVAIRILQSLKEKLLASRKKEDEEAE